MTHTKIAIVEDQTVFREMLAELLRLDQSCQVVGSFGTAKAALQLFERACPDVAIVDLMLPDVSGIDFLKTLHKRFPRLRLLVVTAQERPSIVLEVFRAGVHGIVTKATPLRELKNAVTRVALGQPYYCATSSAVLRSSRGRTALEPLSSREQQIVRLIALGRSSKDIAQELAISPKTVANHRLRISRKLQIRDIAGLTRYAIGRGWIEGDA